MVKFMLKQAKIKSTLFLNGVTIMYKTSAPIYLNNGKKTVLTLAKEARIF